MTIELSLNRWWKPFELRRAFLFEHKDLFGQAYTYDGESNLKSTVRLTDLDDDQCKLVTVTKRNTNEEIQIKIKFTGEVSWSSPERLRLFNTQMRRNLEAMGFALIGNNYYNPKMKSRIDSHNLSIWAGIFTAINQHDGGILMLCDSIYKVVRSETAYDVMKRIRKQNNSNYELLSKNELQNLIVMTNYNNQTYKIEDIKFDENPLQFEFDMRGRTISIKDYYREQYGITIKDEKQPLLSGIPSNKVRIDTTNNQPIYLVPELCLLTGLSDTLFNNMELKRKMTNITKLDPNRRVTYLTNFKQQLILNDKIQNDMKKWGITFENKLISIPAKILIKEEILMGGDKVGSGQNYNQGDFSEEIRGKQMWTTGELSNWGILISRTIDRNIFNVFKKTLFRACSQLGLQLNEPRVLLTNSDKIVDYLECLRNRCPYNAQLVVCIVSGNNENNYLAIKRELCCNKPIPSQIVLAPTILKKQILMSVCTKIGIQIASKIGLEPWVLHIPVGVRFRKSFYANYEFLRLKI